MDINGFSDPYFTIALVPHAESKHGHSHHKTKTHSKTLLADIRLLQGSR